MKESIDQFLAIIYPVIAHLASYPIIVNAKTSTKSQEQIENLGFQMKECYQTKTSRINSSVLSEAYIGGATHHFQNLREQQGPCASTGRKLIWGAVCKKII